MKQTHFALTLTLFFTVAYLGASSPSQAQREDDDILSPADDDALFPEAGPEQVEKLGLKIGFFPLVGLGETDKKLAQEINKGIRTELRAIGVETYRLRLPESRQKRSVGNVKMATHRQKYKAAKNYLKRGKRTLKKLRFRDANKSLRRAIQHYEAAVGALDNVDEVMEAYLKLAESAARQGIENKTVKYLRFVAAMAPEMEMDSSIYPSAFVRTYQQVKYDLFKEGFGSILIDESGAGAEVIIDGQALGTAPLRVSGLPFGKHFVKVSTAKGVFAEVVELSDDAEETLSPNLLGGGGTGPIDDLAENKISEANAKKLGKLAARSSMQFAVVGVFTVRESTIPTSLVIVRPNDGKIVRISALSFDGDLLNLSIESVAVIEAIQSLNNKPNFKPVGDRPLLRGFSQKTSSELTEKKLRYRAKKPRRKLAGGSKKAGSSRSSMLGNGGGDRVVEGGGGSNRRTSLLDDEEDPLGRSPRKNILDESKPASITEQPWFWPTVIGGSTVLGVVGLSSGLIGFGIVPNPLPKDSVAVEVSLPQ